MKKATQLKVEGTQSKAEYERFIIVSTFIVAIPAFMPELAMAADTPAAGGTDAFAAIHGKISGWVKGSAGKLITLISVIMAGVMGVAGFPVKFIIGALGLGLMLASADTIVNMLFAG